MPLGLGPKTERDFAMFRFVGRSAFLSAFCAAVVVLAGACSKSEPPKSDGTAKAEVAADGKPAAELIPASLFVLAEPSGAKDVIPAKKDAKDGESVVIRGRIGGGVDPFVEGRAVFTVADLAMPPCSDHCPTPWDYCCEPASDRAAKTVTVQVVGADGKPMKVTLKDRSGLVPMAEVVVEGRVAQKSAEQPVVINASKIFVKKPS